MLWCKLGGAGCEAGVVRRRGGARFVRRVKSDDGLSPSTTSHDPAIAASQRNCFKKELHALV